MTATPPVLPGDLEAGLRRLRLGAMRRLAPELLVTARAKFPHGAEPNRSVATSEVVLAAVVATYREREADG